MKIKAQSPLLNGWEGDATITTQHPASSYGRAVLVIEGEPIGTQDAWIAGLKVVEATRRERELLKRSGYTTMLGK